MAYNKNILPKDAAYYTLNKATVIDGQFLLEAGGSVSLVIDKTLLSSVTPTMLINIYLDRLVNPLTTEISCYLDIILTTGEIEHLSFYPNQLTDKALSFVIELTDGPYTECMLRIQSKVACRFYELEICPEYLAEIDETIIDGVKQALPRVLHDYNTWELTVAQEEMSIALITFVLLENTDIQGHLLLDFYASEYCNIYIRLKDNGNNELYTPLIYTVQPGHNTIGIPHAYLKRLAGIHSLIATAQCTNGTLTFYIRGILFTIDAGHLAMRTIDAGMDIIDITLSRASQDMSSLEIWAMGIDAGEMLIKKRAYNAESSVPWSPVYSMGKAIDGAIEFDGSWTRMLNDVNYVIQTYEQPHIFVIDDERNLYSYIGNDVKTKFLIDTDVTSVCAIRGYKSELYPEHDQGLICAYIKGSTAYYRQWAYNESTQSVLWSMPVLLAENTKQIQLHRLNDFRLGICLIKTDDSVHWLITERTYVGQTIPAELTSIEHDVYPVVSTIYTTRPNTKGIAAPFEDDTAPQDKFYIQYEYTPYLDSERCLLVDYVGGADTSMYDVTVNNTRVEVKKVYTEKNCVVVQLKEPVEATRTKGDQAVKITFTNYRLCALLNVTEWGHKLPADDQTFNWTIYRPIVTWPIDMQEEVSFNGSYAIDIQQRPIVNIKTAVYEQTLLQVNAPTISFVEHPIVEIKSNTIETTNIDIVKVSASATVVRSGPTPI